MTGPARELTEVLAGLTPGRALDLACGSGRHAMWLAGCGWHVTAVDATPLAAELPGVDFHLADLERNEFAIAPAAWDLIVCWMYWQPGLLPAIGAGVRPGGVVALAGKTDGRFATSLQRYRDAFSGWTELAAGENGRAYFIAVNGVR